MSCGSRLLAAPLRIPLVAVLLLVTLIAGCTSPATHMLVVFDSDMPSSRITQLRVRLLNPTTREQLREQVLYPREGVPSLLPLPSSFTVQPVRGMRDSAMEVRIELSAIASDGMPTVLTRNARFSFTPARGGIVRVYMNVGCDALTTGCAGSIQRCTIAALCESRGLTCGDFATCVVPDVEVEPLDRDAELIPDVRRGPPDAGIDGALQDSATIDGSIDSGDSASHGDGGEAGSCDPSRCPPRMNATARCDAMGQCAYDCVSGFADCDNGPGNGCESSLSSNMHCGRCNNACVGATPLCNGATGMCSSNCASGQTRCGMSCVDVQTDEAHCGMCGRTCRADQQCVAGACRCASGMECGGRCVDTQTDSGNCGMCGRACRADQQCVAGACRCTTGTECAGRCVDTSTDLNHCGMCGRVCAFARASASCVGGACQLGACDPGWGNCDGNNANGCEQDLSASTHCGRCMNACSGGTPVCSGGMCSSGCSGGQTRCGMTCANLMTDRNHCGMCGRACRADQSCVGGVCQCTSGTECSGACVDTSTNLAHCGGCGRACAPANATGACMAGMCRIVSCSAGFANCNSNVADGCEARLDTTSHCGACGNACTPGPMQSAACLSGMCQYSCAVGGRGDCNGSTSDGCETDLNSNLSHCGACGNACPARANATTTCTGGACGFTCNAGWGNCDGNAANGCEQSLSSASHCGMCGRVCSGGTPMCSGGSCVSGCGGGQTLCGMTCVNLSIDVNHCGSCGNVCPSRTNATTTCTGGTCGFTCNAGFADCDSNATNGCETNLNTSTSHCGMCGRSCAVGAMCNAGSCQCPTGQVVCGGQCVNLNTNNGNCGMCFVSCLAGYGCCGGMCIEGIGQECAWNCQRQGTRVCGPGETGQGICTSGGPLYSPPSSVAGIQCDLGGGWGFCSASGMCNLL